MTGLQRSAANRAIHRLVWPAIQRKLVVDGPSDSKDPAANMFPITRCLMGFALVKQCPGFTATFGGGKRDGTIVAESATCAEAQGVVAGKQPLGCYCLCVLVNSPDVWTIRLTEETTAKTIPSGREVIVPPTNSANKSGHWAADDVRVMRPK